MIRVRVLLICVISVYWAISFAQLTEDKDIDFLNAGHNIRKILSHTDYATRPTIVTQEPVVRTTDEAYGAKPKALSKPLGSITQQPDDGTPKTEAASSTASTTPSAGRGQSFVKSVFVKETQCCRKDEKILSQRKKIVRPPKATTTSTTEPKILKDNDGYIKPQRNPKRLTYVDHSFYKSALIYNESYFNNHWMQITNATDTVRLHPKLRNLAFRQPYNDFAYTMHLPFDFPYYGHIMKNITISTGGYLFTGPPGRRFLAQGQSIAPLMTSWDIMIDDESAVVLYEAGDKITFMWEDIVIPEKPDKKFTFGVTLFKNGNIFFVYKDVPLKIQTMLDDIQSIFVGIADSYYLNRISYFVQRKMIHNYSRIPFNNYKIVSGSVLQLIPLPSCPMHNNCMDCIGHKKKYGNFECMWCPSIRKCTSGVDYYRPRYTDDLQRLVQLYAD